MNAESFYLLLVLMGMLISLIFVFFDFFIPFNEPTNM